MKALLTFTTLVILLRMSTSSAEQIEYPGSADALPHDRFVNVVSTAQSPVMQTWIASRDGLYIASAIRRPTGEGPFPAIVIFHGAPGGRGMEQLVGWSRGDHGGPVWERYLREGYVVVVADYRGGDWNTVNVPSDTLVTAIDDGVAVVEHVAALSYVDADRISVYGVSLGGNLALFLASQLPTLRAVVAGAPAPFWFLGERAPFGADSDAPGGSTAAQIAAANIAPIDVPILIQVGSADPLLEIDHELYRRLRSAGKSVRMEIYEHGYHDFVLGPQGQERPDLAEGEKLMQGTLDALERSVDFIAQYSSGR